MLYLIDKPHDDIGLRTARSDDDATIVLIQDGVFLTPDIDAQIYAIERDVEVRGISLPPEVETITYEQLIDLVFESPVKTFV